MQSLDRRHRGLWRHLFRRWRGGLAALLGLVVVVRMSVVVVVVVEEEERECGLLLTPVVNELGIFGRQNRLLWLL